MRIRIVAALAALVVLTGCDQATIDANMAKARAVAAAIKQGALVTSQAIRDGIDAACANQQAVYTSAMVTRSILIQQTGPSSTRNIDNLDKALAAYNNACAAAANPNATNTAYLLSVAISAYNSVRVAQAPTGG